MHFRPPIRPWLRGLASAVLAAALPIATLAASRTPWTASKVQGSPEPPAPAKVTRVFPRVSFQDPVDFMWEPAANRYWVLQLNGQLFSFPNVPDPARPELALDFVKAWAAQKKPLNQTLGFTFHPGFATNRFLFVVYTEDSRGPDGTHLSRFRVTTDDPPQVDPASELPILNWRGGGHNGSSLKFGPDGMLTISTGDSESPEPPDPLRTGQDLSDFLSAILRVDVDHPADGKNYSISQDNPFRNRPGAKPEVWAYGFRNPWRTSFGPDGALWLGDVGWELWETVHRVTAGYNGGWSVVEGPQPIYPEIRPPTSISEPVARHPHSEAASITGGFFYFGKKLPRWRGHYIYGDWETGKIWALDPAGQPKPQPVELCDTPLRIIAFAPAADGEMLVLEYRDGKPISGIYRLEANEAGHVSANFPRKLSETGLFADLNSLQPAPGVSEYQTVATMWADHATSQRWLALPGDSAITTERGHIWSEVSWTFPSNAVVAKTLSLELTPGNPTTRRRMETQLLHFDGENWQAYSYRWNEAQTDADLVGAAGENVTLRVKDAAAPDGEREQTWRYASRSECFRCHNYWSGMTIGVGWDSLAGKPLAGHGPSEFARLVDLGLIRETRKPEKPPATLVDPADPTAPLATRARSWLHLNCTHCHRNGAGGAVSAYFSAEIPLADLRIQDVVPLRGGFGLPNARLIAPGDPWRSVVYHRASTTGGGHMPALGSRSRDEAGLALLRDWIRTVPDRTGVVPPAGDISMRVTELASTSAGAPRIAALRAAFTNTAVALAALDLGRTDSSFRADATAAGLNHPNSAARDLFLPWLRPDQIRPVLGEDFPPATVLALSGEPERGRILFHAETGPNCSRCHTVGGQGRNYGPDLTTIGTKYDAATLLRHITEPNLAIAPEYALQTVELKDGTVWTGFPIPAGPAELAVRCEDGVHQSPRSEVLRVEKSAQSAMPSGLLAPLTAAEAADLLAYLKSPPK